jgi:hypothetical protein
MWESAVFGDVLTLNSKAAVIEVDANSSDLLSTHGGSFRFKPFTVGA